MALNLTIVALYVINAWTRMAGSVSANVSLGLSLVAIALLLVSGWLGGKMVFEDGVAVHADEAATATDRRSAERASAWTRSPSAGGFRTPGERAMASDSDKPSRMPGESRSE
jgi:hypothetical protein